MQRHGPPTVLTQTMVELLVTLVLVRLAPRLVPSRPLGARKPVTAHR